MLKTDFPVNKDVFSEMRTTAGSKFYAAFFEAFYLRYAVKSTELGQACTDIARHIYRPRKRTGRNQLR